MPQLSVARERKRRNSRQPRQRFQIHTMAALILLMPVLATPALAQPVAKAEIVANLGHTFGQCCAVYLPGGRYLISAGTDRSVRLWDRTTGRLIRTFRGSGAIKSLAVMPDGSAVLSGTTDGAIELWETASGRLLRTLQGHKKVVLSLAVSADGGYIASASDDGTVRIWNAATGLQLRVIADHHSPVSALAFTPDKPRVISGDENGMVAVHDLATGKITRKWKADSFLTSLAVTPDGSRVITGGADQLVQIWDLATGASIRTIKRHTGRLNGVAVAPDGGRIASVAGDRSIRVWDSVTGEQVFGVVATSLLNVFSVEFSPDGKQLLFTGTGRGAVELNIESRQVSREYGGSDTQLAFAIAYSLQGDLLAVGTVSGTIDLWDTATARLLQSIKAHAQNVKSLAFSQDGAWLLSGSDDGTLSLSDVASGRLLHALGQNKSGITAVAFSPDGRLALSGGDEYKIQLWDTGTGQLVREIAAEASASAVAFSADARQLISAQGTGEIKVWDTASGQLVRSIGRYPSSSFPVALSRDGSLALTSSGDYDDAEKRLKLWSTTNATPPLAFAGTGGDITSVALSTDPALAVSATYIGGLKYLFWDARTGRLVSPLEAPTDGTGDLVLSPDGKRLAGTGRDGSVKVWNLETGRVIAGMFRGADQSWLTISLPHGFFAGTPEGARNISIVRGLEIYDVSQVYQSLFNPDLVSESMAGDPAGEAQNAAAALDLDKVLDSGAAPLVAFGTVPADAQAAELFTAETRITDQGGGIGRVEWRVNGVTAGVESPAGTTTGSTITIARTLALEPGQNSIEAVAYNGRNLLASLPARGTITFAGPADTAKPKLHVLAIGIDDYVDQGWTPPGASAPVKFPRLNLAVKDATTFGADMKRAAAGAYGEVRVTAVLDKEATRQNLDRIVTQLAGEIHPRDTVVLFAAAHGFSSNGRFYLIPQDYQGGTNPVALAAGAVDQRQLQDWIANRIKARRAVILLDTCESGALVGGYTRSRTDTPASEAAVGRLHEATGRPILTAAATGKPAFEGYKGHGVFTWALLDALRNGDRNGNGSIELSELVAHVQDLVPKLSAELKGRGRAAIAVRGSIGDRQSARFGSRGEDFVLTQRLR